MDAAQALPAEVPAQPTPPTSTPSPGAEVQNLPTISNLINPPQGGADAQVYQEPVTAAVTTTQKPQEKTAVPHPGQPVNLQSLAASSAIDQPRVTKGKYSLADFNILRTLGTGSFGRVHLVQSRHNQRFYAVKVLKKAQVVRMKQVEHTNDERRMLGEVKNPFLITLWGTFQDAKNLYMVMDFVEGGELFSLLRKSAVGPDLYYSRAIEGHK